MRGLRLRNMMLRSGHNIAGLQLRDPKANARWVSRVTTSKGVVIIALKGCGRISLLPRLVNNSN